MRNHPKKRPLIMSHVGLHEFMPHPMNPTAAEIRAIADTGGVIGIIAMSYYLTKPEKKDCLETIIKMIDFMIEHHKSRCSMQEFNAMLALEVA